MFKTTLNEFKNRDRYIKDDYRFIDRFSKLNPRKIIRLWAEKEMHNLTRYSRSGPGTSDKAAARAVTDSFDRPSSVNLGPFLSFITREKAKVRTF